MSTGLSTSVTTGTINVTAAAASQLVVITNPPTPMTAGTQFGFEVEAEDQYGNLNTSFNGTVTAALANNGGNANATLTGQITAVVSNGIAVFSGLTEDQAGSGYTILVTSTGLSPARRPAPSASCPPRTRSSCSWLSRLAPSRRVIPLASKSRSRIPMGTWRHPSVASCDRPVERPGQRRAQRIAHGMLRAGRGLVLGLSIDTAAAGYTIEATTATWPR